MYCQLGQVGRTAEGSGGKERRCRDTRQEILVLSERQEITIYTSTMEDKAQVAEQSKRKIS